MARLHDTPDLRSEAEDVTPAPEELSPPSWVSDGATYAARSAAQLAPLDGSPPTGLSNAATAWWLATVEEFELEPHHLRTLSEAAWAWDRCQQARMLINHQGLVVQDPSGQLQPHPACAIEHDSRMAYLRAMRELDLDDAPARESAPASGEWRGAR